MKISRIGRVCRKIRRGKNVKFWHCDGFEICTTDGTNFVSYDDLLKQNECLEEDVFDYLSIFKDLSCCTAWCALVGRRVFVCIDGLLLARERYVRELEFRCERIFGQAVKKTHLTELKLPKLKDYENY